MQAEVREDAQELHWQEHRADIFLARVVLDLLCAREGDRLRPRDVYNDALPVWDDPGDLLAIAPLPMDDICSFLRSRYEEDKDRWKDPVIPKILESELAELCNMAGIRPPTPHNASSESPLTEDCDNDEERDRDKAATRIASLAAFPPSATPTRGTKRKPTLDTGSEPAKRTRVRKR